MPDRIKLEVIRFGLEEKWEEMNHNRQPKRHTKSGAFFIAFPPKAQNQRNGRSPGLPDFVCLLSL
jgi:hypothetical protein